jgi:hypothetical protein
MGFSGTNPPTFELDGREKLYRLTFFKKLGDGEQTTSYCVIWRVVAEKSEPKSFGEIKEITYGVVPPGYAQEFPSRDAPPEVLAPGAYYEYHFETDVLPNYPREFEIKDGRASHTLME